MKDHSVVSSEAFLESADEFCNRASPVAIQFSGSQLFKQLTGVKGYSRTVSEHPADLKVDGASIIGYGMSVDNRASPRDLDRINNNHIDILRLFSKDKYSSGVGT